MTRRTPRRSREGMTLIEIMVVILLIGMLAAGVAVHVMGAKEESEVRIARTGAFAIRSAAMMLRLDEPGSPCPTVDALVERELLDPEASVVDPWNTGYRIECEGSRVRVFSAGPDAAHGTEDDVEGARR